MTGPAAGTREARPAHSGLLGVIRVGLVDDHHLIREGLRLVLQVESSFEIVGEAADHASAVELVVTSGPMSCCST